MEKQKFFLIGELNDVTVIFGRGSTVGAALRNGKWNDTKRRIGGFVVVPEIRLPKGAVWFKKF